MVQILSIIFFLDFFNFCWVFQTFPFFVSLCTLKEKKNHNDKFSVSKEQNVTAILFTLPFSMV